MPGLLVSTFHYLQSILHTEASVVFYRCDWVLLITCLKPSDELPLCFKVNPNPLRWPSKPSLIRLCSPLQTHLRPPYPYLCPPDIACSFKASDMTLSVLPSKLKSLCPRCPALLCLFVQLALAQPSDLSLNVILSVGFSWLSPWCFLFLFLCFTATHIFKRLFKSSVCLFITWLWQLYKEKTWSVLLVTILDNLKISSH